MQLLSILTQRIYEFFASPDFCVALKSGSHSQLSSQCFSIAMVRIGHSKLESMNQTGVYERLQPQSRPKVSCMLKPSGTCEDRYMSSHQSFMQAPCMGVCVDSCLEAHVLHFSAIGWFSHLTTQRYVDPALSSFQ